MEQSESRAGVEQLETSAELEEPATPELEPAADPGPELEPDPTPDVERFSVSRFGPFRARAASKRARTSSTPATVEPAEPEQIGDRRRAPEHLEPPPDSPSSSSRKQSSGTFPSGWTGGLSGSLSSRMRRLVAVLEHYAGAGDADAAKAALAHHRWAHEMKHGRPRGETAAPTVVIVDGIGRALESRAARPQLEGFAAEGSRSELPPAGEPER